MNDDDFIECPSCKNKVTSHSWCDYDWEQDKDGNGVKLGPRHRHFYCKCGKETCENDYNDESKYPRTHICKIRQIDVYSFHKLEEIFGLKTNSIRHIEIDGLNEIVRILHDDENKDAIPYASEMYVMHKRR